jgi:hypothetical protein
MEYAAQLLNPRTVLVPALALVIGAGGAIGIYSALDDADPSIIQPTRVVVTDPPVKPGEGTAAKDEAVTAAAIGSSSQSTPFEGKDEAATAAAVGNSSQSTPFEGKDEAATAAAVGNSSQSSPLESREESSVHTSSPRTWLEEKGSQIRPGGGPPAEDRATANRTDPHGPAAALP